MDPTGTAVACVSLGLYVDIVRSSNMRAILELYRVWQLTNPQKVIGTHVVDVSDIDGRRICM
jgi:hypothetical protein